MERCDLRGKGGLKGDGVWEGAVEIV